MVGLVSEEEVKKIQAQGAVYVPVSVPNTGKSSTGITKTGTLVPLAVIPVSELSSGGRAALEEAKAANVGATAPDAASAAQQVRTSSQSQNENNTAAARATLLTNPLEKYTNYSYGISLHAMTMKKYNDVVVRGVPYTTDDGSVLIASGGRRGENFKRNQFFQTDMFIESLKMTTVIGYNSRSRGSNVIDLNFTIVEPYGMTIIERLLKVSEDYDIKRWDHMIFMLQIDFFANDDQGIIVGPISDQIKYIPIRIVDLKVKVNVKGSEYRITAVPAGHMGYLESTATTPVIFEVLAKTIEQFFTPDPSDSSISEANSNNSRPAQTTSGTRNPQSASENKSKVEKIYSYVSAMNRYQEHLVKEKYQDQADKYVFVIEDEDLKNSKLIHNSKANPISNTQMNTTRSRSDKPDPETELTRINAGSSVLDVINLMIRNSEYYVKLVKENVDKSQTTDQPVTIHKIIPSVEIGGWDSKRNTYQKTITYTIKKYSYYNTKSTDVRRSLPSSWSKEYNYIYTGKNQQVLDFDIDFNTMFFTILTADRNRAGKNVPQFGGLDTAPQIATTNQEGKIQQNQFQFKSITQESSGRANTMDGAVVAANDFYTASFMSNSRGDMINVKLKISGDPHFIKQDDSFFPPGHESLKSQLNANNSINMDSGQVFVFLNFKTPDDLNLETGRYDINEGISTFSGIYMVITIDNQFERGQFVQVLDLVRLFDQKTDQVSGTKNTQTSAVQRIPSAFNEANARAAEEAYNQEYNLGKTDTRATENPNRSVSVLLQEKLNNTGTEKQVQTNLQSLVKNNNETITFGKNPYTGVLPNVLQDPLAAALRNVLDKPGRPAQISDFKP